MAKGAIIVSVFSKSFNLHFRLLAALDDRDGFARVNAIRSDGVAVQIANRLH